MDTDHQESIIDQLPLQPSPSGHTSCYHQEKDEFVFSFTMIQPPTPLSMRQYIVSYYKELEGVETFDFNSTRFKTDSSCVNLKFNNTDRFWKRMEEIKNEPE